jgi:UDP-4-amino-4,6-dideoxy-L-N-acetyl-beta-L-altrosamine transaminase
MIPISARGREREALENFSFVFDAAAIEKLEAAVSAYHGCAYAVAFNTPESAMTAALTAAGVNSGDVVIAAAMAPQHHYSALARLQAGVRYCDIGLDGNLYPRALTSLARDDMKAVLFSHFEGIRAVRPALPDTVETIEDITASLTPFTVTRTTLWSLESLMPEGVEKTGFVLTDDAKIAETAKLFRQSGRKNGAVWNYDLLLKGSDAALSAITASVALRQMETLEAVCDRRRETASHLDDILRSTLFDKPKRTSDDAPASYPILLIPQLYCPKEDIFLAIEEQGVEAAVCCKPVYKTSAFRDESVRLPVTEDFYKALLQLPCHHRLSREEVEKVAHTVRDATETYAYRGCRF